MTPLDEIAARIRAHLQRFAEDPDIADHKWTDGKGVTRSSAAYWHPSASRAGSRLVVTYVSYQGSTTLSKADADRYLAWLDAGHIGKHWKALAGQRSATAPDTAGE